MRRAWAIILIACVTALIVPAAASAVTVLKSTNGIVIQPETGVDYGTCPQVRVYYDYKGGANFSASYPPFSTGSYNSSELVVSSSTLPYDLLEVPLKSGYRIQRVEIASQKADNSGATTVYSVVLNEPLNVAQQGAVTVGSIPPVAVSEMPSVTLAGQVSASLDQTLTVDPWGTANLPEGWIVVLYTLALLAFGAGLAWVIVGRPWVRS